MNIGFDAKRFFWNNSGLGNYSRDLICNYIEEFPENNYFLFTTQINEKYIYLLNKYSNVEIITPQKIWGNFKSIWRTFAIDKLCNQNKIDVYLGLSHEMPFKKKTSSTKYIVVIHDLIWMIYPKNYKFIDRYLYTKKIKYSAKKADRIIAISKTTKEDITKLLLIDQDKIDIAYQSCNKIFYNNIKEEIQQNIAKKFNLPQNFILTVGTIEKRKNLETLLKALTQTKYKAKLIIIGRKTDYYYNTIEKIINDNKLKDRLIFFDGIYNDELACFYQLSKLFVYISNYEGFGIPILEAMYSNTPIITTRNTSMEEISGKYGYYIDNNDYIELARHIDYIYSNESKVQDIVIKARLKAQKFSNKNHIIAINKTIKKIVS